MWLEKKTKKHHRPPWASCRWASPTVPQVASPARLRPPLATGRFFGKKLKPLSSPVDGRPPDFVPHRPPDYVPQSTPPIVPHGHSDSLLTGRGDARLGWHSYAVTRPPEYVPHRPPWVSPMGTLTLFSLGAGDATLGWHAHAVTGLALGRVGTCTVPHAGTLRVSWAVCSRYCHRSPPRDGGDGAPAAAHLPPHPMLAGMASPSPLPRSHQSAVQAWRPSGRAGLAPRCFELPTV